MKQIKAQKICKTLVVIATAIALTVIAPVSAFATESQIEEQSARSDYVQINGRNLFHGETFTKNGVTFVPMFRFASWLGNFKYNYDSRAKTASITGENLKISAKDGTLYIEANGRYFYTSEAITIRNGEMYVPIKPLVKALNSHISYDGSRGIYVVGSGDTRLLKSDRQVYDPDDIYWLAKIISAFG